MTGLTGQPDAPDPGLAAVKDAVGGNTGLARALDDKISPQAISQWKRIPVARVAEIEKATGIPRHRQRPDIFESPEKESAA